MDAFIAAPTSGAPRVLSALGVEIAVLSSDAPGGSAATVMRYSAPAGFRGVQPHRHRLATEWFYILEGTMALTLEGHIVSLGERGFIEVPPCTPHHWRNAESDRPLVFLFGFDRSGMGGYFGELFAFIANSPAWPPSDPSLVEAIGARYDTFPVRE